MAYPQSGMGFNLSPYSTTMGSDITPAGVQTMGAQMLGGINGAGTSANGGINPNAGSPGMYTGQAAQSSPTPAQPLNFNDVNSAYQGALGRNIGTEGANFYMNSGKSLEQIKADLAYSPEGKQYAGSQQQRYVAPQNQISGLTYASNQTGPQTGLMGSEQALMQGLGGATDVIAQGAAQGRQDIQGGLGQANQAYNQGAAGLNPFSQGGQQAQQKQLALSGALGADAQAQAYQNFQSSPGQDWLRQQGEQGVTRNAAAIGGLGGGNVQKELSRFNQGLASQDYQNQFANLGSLSSQGLTAAGNIGNLRSNQGNMQMNAANNMANISTGTGNILGQNVMNTGINLATGRNQAGRDIASNVQGTTNNLSTLINQQGSVLSDLIGQGGGQMQTLITAASNGDAAAQQQLAALLGNANIATGSQVGSAGAAPVYNPAAATGQMAGGIAGVLGNWPASNTTNNQVNSNAFGGNYQAAPTGGTQNPNYYGGYA